jgi:hypothetical protein
VADAIDNLLAWLAKAEPDVVSLQAFPGEQKPVLIFEALQPASRYVVLGSRCGLVRLWFSRKPFSYLVVFPGRIPAPHPSKGLRLTGSSGRLSSTESPLHSR